MTYWLVFLGTLLLLAIACVFLAIRLFSRLPERQFIIFISYAGEDRHKALEISRALKRLGLLVYMYDPVKPWSSAWAGMARGMNAARVVLFLRPAGTVGLAEVPGNIPHSIVENIKTPSPFVQAELDLATNLNRPVMQIRDVNDLDGLLAELKNIPLDTSELSEEEAINTAADIFEKHFPGQDPRDEELTREKLEGELHDEAKFQPIAFIVMGVAVVFLVLLIVFVTLAIWGLYHFFVRN